MVLTRVTEKKAKVRANFFRKNSREQSVFLVFCDFGWAFGPPNKTELQRNGGGRGQKEGGGGKKKGGGGNAKPQETLRKQFPTPLSAPPPRLLLGSFSFFQRKGGGKEGGKRRTSRGDPPQKAVSDPPSASPPLPRPFLFSKSLRDSQRFAQVTSSQTAFGGFPKMGSKGPSSRGLALRCISPPLFELCPGTSKTCLLWSFSI